MTVFQKARSLYLTSFANKCLNIGLGLIPMLLIERELSSTTSSWVMGFVKAATVTGSILGGWLSDRIGLKQTLVLAFLLSALGLIALPLVTSVVLICVAGMIAHAGQSFFGGSAKMFLSQLVLPSERQEAIGWLRMFNNGAQIFSYGIGWIFSKLGIMVLMFLDAGASLIAAIVGILYLPKTEKKTSSNENTPVEEPKPFKRSDWELLCLAVLIIGSFDFIYELVLVGIAAKCKLVFGDQGLEVFSQAMVINTVLCTAFSVSAARWFRNPNIAFPLGIVLAAGGAALCFTNDTSKELIFIGMFVHTLGEIVFMAVASLVLLLCTPETKNQGAIYGAVLSLERTSRIAGGAAAFPLVVHGSHPIVVISLTGLVGVFFWIFARKRLARLSHS